MKNIFRYSYIQIKKIFSKSMEDKIVLSHDTYRNNVAWDYSSYINQNKIKM